MEASPCLSLQHTQPLLPTMGPCCPACIPPQPAASPVRDDLRLRQSHGMVGTACCAFQQEKGHTNSPLH
jgi:hypothetical protein